MGAVLLLVMLVCIVANLVLTVRIYKGGSRMGAADGKVIDVPRGEPKVKSVDDIDYEKLVAAAMSAVEVNAEESGEEETQLDDVDISEVTKAVMAAMQK